MIDFRIDNHAQRFVRCLIIRLLILRFRGPVVFPVAEIRELSLVVSRSSRGSWEEAAFPEACHEVICPLLIFFYLLFDLWHLEFTFVETSLAIIAVYLVVQVLVDVRHLVEELQEGLAWQDRLQGIMNVVQSFEWVVLGEIVLSVFLVLLVFDELLIKVFQNLVLMHNELVEDHLVMLFPGASVDLSPEVVLLVL